MFGGMAAACLLRVTGGVLSATGVNCTPGRFASDGVVSTARPRFMITGAGGLPRMGVALTFGTGDDAWLAGDNRANPGGVLDCDVFRPTITGRMAVLPTAFVVNTGDPFRFSCVLTNTLRGCALVFGTLFAIDLTASGDKVATFPICI